jgi:hypothetical protein
MSTARVPARLLEMAAAHQRAKTLFAIVELGVPALLAEAPQTIPELARRLGLHPLAADRLLHAGVALGLLERHGDRFSNAADTATFLVPGLDTDLTAVIRRMNDVSYPLWGDLVRRLREWRPGDSEGEPPSDADQGVAALQAQHNLSRLVGLALAEAHEFEAHRLLLDIGGGTGPMSIGVCERHRHLRAIVMDREPIATAAREAVAASGLADRIRVESGDYLAGPLPEGFDVVLLANVLSVASERSNRDLLRLLHERLPAGGAVLLSGWILDDDRTGPLLPVLFCLEDINWNAPDVERTASRYAGWLEEAGFTDVRQNLYASPTRLIAGRKS